MHSSAELAEAMKNTLENNRYPADLRDPLARHDEKQMKRRDEVEKQIEKEMRDRQN